MNHALVVGGTGMLRGTCLGLVRAGWTVSVLARLHSTLSSLARDGAAGPGRVVPVPADYTNWEAAAAAIRSASIAQGPISLVVAWIHATAPHAPRQLAELVADEARPCRYFHVRGGTNDDPSGDDASGAGPAHVAGVAYRRVVLGFVMTPEGSRWLTHDEIAAGVLRAIQSDAVTSTIGQTRPRSRRPG
jgi:hypothetical protein